MTNRKIDNGLIKYEIGVINKATITNEDHKDELWIILSLLCTEISICDWHRGQFMWVSTSLNSD